MLKEIYYPLKSIIASSLIDILLYIDDNLPYSIYCILLYIRIRKHKKRVTISNGLWVFLGGGLGGQ
jgi:hypothetical protein